MKRLEQTLKKNGFIYRLVQRTEHVAIYDQVGYAYEVFKVRVAKPWKYNPDYSELFPSNEDFGKTAWSFGYFGDSVAAKDRALAKYSEICVAVEANNERSPLG